MNKALISVTVYLSEGDDVIKQVYNELNSCLPVKAVSSVFSVSRKVNKSNKIHDIMNVDSYTGLTMVCEIETLLMAEEIVDTLIKLENLNPNPEGHKLFKLVLLTFNEESLMTPRHTVPYPQLHQMQELLVPASELWPEYVHPILEKSLTELANENKEKSWGEFYSRSQTLLDF